MSKRSLCNSELSSIRPVQTVDTIGPKDTLLQERFNSTFIPTCQLCPERILRNVPKFTPGWTTVKEFSGLYTLLTDIFNCSHYVVAARQLAYARKKDERHTVSKPVTYPKLYIASYPFPAGIGSSS